MQVVFFCVAWDDKSDASSIYEAYAMPVSVLVSAGEVPNYVTIAPERP